MFYAAYTCGMFLNVTFAKVFNQKLNDKIALITGIPPCIGFHPLNRKQVERQFRKHKLTKNVFILTLVGFCLTFSGILLIKS